MTSTSTQSMDLDKESFEKLSQISDPLSEFDFLRITESTPIPNPIPVVTINNEVISTEGNITTLSGASKSGKSALTSIILAGAISHSGNYDGLDELKIKVNSEKKAVIHIDTEQARHKHKMNLFTILKRSGLSKCPEYFLTYNFRQLEVKDFEYTTMKLCEIAAEKYNGIHTIVIDGIADYIMDVNDPEESNRIVKFFEDISIKFNTPLITIIHTNPNSEKERGHLGSQLQRKSESVLTIKKDQDISYLEPKYLRMASNTNIPSLQFSYDRDKGYHVARGTRSQNNLTDKDRKIIDLKIQTFGEYNAFKYDDAIKAIMKASLKSERAGKEYFKIMKASGMIIQDSEGKWRSNSMWVQ